jgi:hypothetical protein
MRDGSNVAMPNGFGELPEYRLRMNPGDDHEISSREHEPYAAFSVRQRTKTTNNKSAKFRESFMLLKN